MSRARVLSFIAVVSLASLTNTVSPASAERRSEAPSVPTPVVSDRDEALGARQDLRHGVPAPQPLRQAGQEPMPGLQIIEATADSGSVEGIESTAWDFRRRDGYSIRFQHLLASGSLASDSTAGRLLPTPVAGAEVLGADDGQGGRYVAWVEGGRGDGDLYALRLAPDGRVASGWPEAGLPVALGPYSAMQPVIVASEGGMWIAWQDHRDRVRSSIFAQKLQANGQFWPGLPAEGLRVSLSEGDQSSPAVVSDEQGGLFIVWLASSPEESVVRLSRLNPDGSIAVNWPAEGLVASPKGSRPTDPRLTALSESSLLLAWEDGGVAQASLRALKLETDGSLTSGWPAQGVTFSARPGRNSSPQVVADGQGGAFVAWTSDQDSTGQVLLARFGPTGEMASGWAATGLVVGEVTGNSDAASLLADGAGGVFIAWEDRRSGDSDLRAQRFLGTSAVAEGWAPEGVVVASSPGHQFLPRLTDDGAGGAFVTWSSSNAARGEGDMSTHLLSLVTLRSTEAWSDLVRITWDLDKSLTGTWTVQHLTSEGRWEAAVGTVSRSEVGLVFEDASPPVGELARYRLILVANDRGVVLPEVAVSVPVVVPLALHAARTDGQILRVKLALESRSPARLEGYDVQGRRVLRADLRNLPPGAQDVSVPLPAHFAPGVYFLRLEQGRASRNGRFVHLR